LNRLTGRLWALGLLGLLPGWALDTQLAGDYVVARWQVLDGLPQNSVNWIGQTPDGYLWLATFKGLARFDGVRFVVFDPANSPGLASESILCCYVDRVGGLWVVTESRVLVRLWQGRFRTCGSEVGVPEAGVERVCEDASGCLWMADTRAALYRWQDGRFGQMVAPGGFGSGQVFKLVNDGEGNLWFKQGSAATRWVDGKLIPLTGADGQPAVVNHLTPLGGGGMWVMTPGALRRHRHGRWTGESWPCPESKTHFHGSATDRFGNLWIGTFGDGVYRFSPVAGWTHFTAGTGLESKAVRSVFADAEGSVWVGTDGGGLHRFRPRSFVSIGAAEGVPGNLIKSLSQDGLGRVWLAIKDEPLGWLERDGPTWAFRRRDLPDPQSWWSVCADRGGGLWLGTYQGGVFRYRDDELTCIATAAGQPIGTVQALFQDRRGAIWVAGQQGVSRFHGTEVKHYGLAEGLSSLKVRAFADDAQGRLYIATAAGLNRLSGDHWTVFGRAQGLSDDEVTAVCVAQSDTVWLATDRSGLHRFKGDRFTACTTQQGVANPGITGLITDDAGHLWLAGKRGIFRLTLAELETAADDPRSAPACVHYDQLDGLATPQCTDGIQPSVWKASDGRIWFATAMGVAVVDPKRLVRNPRPPPVLIEEVSVDGRTVCAGSTAMTKDPVPGLPQAFAEAAARATPAALRLPAGAERIEFQFTALSFAAPEKVRFRHRLEGLDSHWVHDGTARQASYSGLPAGRYRFLVQACNDDGVWNHAGAALALTLLPPWWQTGWFRAVALALAGGLVFGFYEWRIRQLHRRRAAHQEFSRRLLASQEEERKRIAGELHDGLGQSLLVVRNRAVLGLKAGEDLAAMRAQLREISEVSGQAIEEVRGIARALRPYQLDRLGLTLALRALAGQQAASSSFRVETDIAELRGRVSSGSAIHLYRIVQESLRNVAEHAHAATVRLAVRVATDRLHLTIEDDGQGFDAAAPDAAASRLRVAGHRRARAHSRGHPDD
jgi:ligand-binding sensor domain-containing protein/signal transduction histidine kinase